jgi:hypothetical protein
MKSAVYLTSAALALALVVVAGGTLWAQDDVQSKVTSIEKSLWEAWKAHDAKPFEMYLTEGTVNINAGGISAGKAQVIKEIADNPCDVDSFSFSDWKLHKLSEDTVMLTYHATQKGMCDGEALPEEVYVSSTYVNKGGKWMAASYHESSIPK